MFTMSLAIAINAKDNKSKSPIFINRLDLVNHKTNDEEDFLQLFSQLERKMSQLNVAVF